MTRRQMAFLIGLVVVLALVVYVMTNLPPTILPYHSGLPSPS